MNPNGPPRTTATPSSSGSGGNQVPPPRNTSWIPLPIPGSMSSSAGVPLPISSSTFAQSTNFSGIPPNISGISSLGSSHYPAAPVVHEEILE